jgi:hypothetical protein
LASPLASTPYSIVPWTTRGPLPGSFPSSAFLPTVSCTGASFPSGPRTASVSPAILLIGTASSGVVSSLNTAVTAVPSADGTTNTKCARAPAARARAATAAVR